MQTTETLTEHQWQTVHAIAQTLVKAEVDDNELRKAMVYLRACAGEEGAGIKFFRYLETLVALGKKIGHSQSTIMYYTNIEDACTRFLTPYQNDVPGMLSILGWTFRLIKYYQEAGPLGEVAPPPPLTVPSARQAEVAAAQKSQKLEEGQLLEATVTKIKGSEVTYEMLGAAKGPVKAARGFDGKTFWQ
ncbi:hypothetical protein [Anthocerotibacter panamensis]|uniref:hypothetical protein n=1 Tax=Anthocerotibacter panamensis TaxID=2857077 RepID=UPI001C4015D4|nr:hypothetical protein [Anthocerotibacter panamensis]